MRKHIDNLAKGKFEYDPPQLSLSPEKIDIQVQEGLACKGSFHITASNGRLARGIVFSTNFRMVCINSQFEGTDIVVNYIFETDGLRQGERSGGKFVILSNGGEYGIDFGVAILPPCSQSTLEKISGLKNFTEFANENWAEAFRVFNSEKGKYIFGEQEQTARVIWGDFLKQLYRPQDMEEFLCAMGNKPRAAFTLEEGEHEFACSGEHNSGSILVSRQGWGYLEIRVQADSPALWLEKQVITPEDFQNMEYSMQYQVDEALLHKGRNFVQITFTSIHQQEVYQLCIRSDQGRSQAARDAALAKQRRIDLEQKYIAFRLGKIPAQEWGMEAIDTLSILMREEPEQEIYQLYRVQAFFISGQKPEARALLESLRKRYKKHNVAPQLWGYYLYLSTLDQAEGGAVRKTASKISQLYRENRESGLLLWILLYLDTEELRDDYQKVREIERHVNAGSSSPLLYLEAWFCFQRDPALLSRLQSFELQTLAFMMRQDLISQELARQIMDLAGRGKSFGPLLYRLMCHCHDKYPCDEFVGILCSVLIRSNQSGKKYHKWFEMGIEADLRIARIYEYYMMSLDLAATRELPQTVYMYFRYNNTLNSRQKAFLYASIIRGKERYGELYRQYCGIIEAFMKEQLAAGRISMDLKVIYDEFMKKELVDQETAQHLCRMMFTWRFTCEDKRVCQILVLQEQMREAGYQNVVDREAFVQIYSDNYRIVLKDIYGNTILSDVEWQLTRLFSDVHYAQYLRLLPDCEPLILLDFSKKQIREANEANVDLFHTLEISGKVKESCKRELRRQILGYYDRFRDDARLSEHIFHMDDVLLGAVERNQLIALYIEKGRFRESGLLIHKYGYDDIDPHALARLAGWFLEEGDMEEDHFLTLFCWDLYEKGVRDEQVLAYLELYYHGTAEKLCRIYESAKACSLDCEKLPERIIGEVLFTGQDRNISEIFEAYRGQGGDRVVIAAYLSYFSFRFLLLEEKVAPALCGYLRSEYSQGRGLNDCCKLALLKFYAAKSRLSAREQELTEELLKGFIMRGMYFAFFQSFPTQISAVSYLQDKTFVEYRGSPDSSLTLHYRQDQEGEEYVAEPMEPLYGGIFSRQYTLFFGDCIDYFITEEFQGGERVVASGKIMKNDFAAHEQTRYQMLNDMFMKHTLGAQEELEALMKEYQEKLALVNHVFRLI